MADREQFTVLLGVTGSIAAYKTPDLVRQLRALRDPKHPDRGVNVRVALTAAGAHFVTPMSLQVVSGNMVMQDMFELPREWDVGHVALADDADLCLIAPATADIIAKLAVGLADDLLSSVGLAMRAPMLIAPAMNVHMWEHPATRENCRLLQERGAIFIGPDTGELACGYEGRGRMSPIEEVVAAVKPYFLDAAKAPKAVAPRSASCDLAGRKVVVTAGPTREHLDPARFISNPSTGKMGYALARAAKERGAEVTLISGPVTLAAPAGVTVVSVTTTEEMAEAAAREAREADAVIGAAAPADFAPAQRAAQKISKAGRERLTVELAPTPDIIAQIGDAKRPGQVVVAFAAETENLEARAAEKLARKNADLIVANDISAPGAGFGADTNRGILLYADGRRQELPMMSKADMACHILDAVAGLLGK